MRLYSHMVLAVLSFFAHTLHSIFFHDSLWSSTAAVWWFEFPIFLLRFIITATLCGDWFVPKQSAIWITYHWCPATGVMSTWLQGLYQLVCCKPGLDNCMIPILRNWLCRLMSHNNNWDTWSDIQWYLCDYGIIPVDVVDYKTPPPMLLRIKDWEKKSVVVMSWEDEMRIHDLYHIYTYYSIWMRSCVRWIHSYYAIDMIILILCHCFECNHLQCVLIFLWCMPLDVFAIFDVWVWKYGHYGRKNFGYNQFFQGGNDDMKNHFCM